MHKSRKKLLPEFNLRQKTKNPYESYTFCSICHFDHRGIADLAL